MNWDAIGAIAETLGAIGVITTLAYLSVQLRQNSRLLRTSSAALTTSGSTTLNLLMIQDPDIARIMSSGSADRAALSESDRLRFDSMQAVNFQHFIQEYDFMKEGMMSEGSWNNRVAWLKWSFAQPGIRDWWKKWSDTYHLPPEFRQLVESFARDEEGFSPSF